MTGFENTGKKILIADDDPAIVDALQFMLEEAGYKVTITVEGEKVEKLVLQKPDLLLLDIWMSGSDGRKICKRLKTNRNTSDIPVIMISANKDTEEYSKQAGADDFISKPFEMEELLQKVKAHIS
jgi:DNA-binding response OmpR family regulator